MGGQKIEEQERSGFFSTFFYCLTLSWKASKLYTVVRIASQTLTPILTIVAAFIGKYLLDLLTGEWPTEDAARTLLLLFACLLAISLLRAVSQKIQQYCQSMHDDVVRGRLALIMMDHSLTADLEYFDNPAYHDKLITATRDSMAIATLLWSALSCVSAAVSFLGAFLVLCQANVLYGFLMAGAAFPSSIAAAKYTKSLYHLSLAQINGERQKSYYQGIAVDRDYAQDLRLFNAGESLKNRYSRLWQELFAKRRDMTRRRTVLTCLLDCLPEVVVVLIGANIAFQVLGGTATVGDYSLYTGLLSQLWAAISLLTHSTMQIYDNQLKIANVKTLRDFHNRIEDKGKKRLGLVESIEFEHVSFTYPGADEPALEEVSFFFRRQEKVALVGLNGSGKSTLIKLILRLYDPDRGVIRINGVDIKEYRLSELRANFSVYFQDMRNYSFTLRDNLTIADEAQKNVEEAAAAALRNSCCEDILKQADRGLDTNLTRFFAPDGIELSGGQQQKLALARAFYRRHTALILDEPSSNLDPKAEKEIFQALQKLTQGKMTIFTSHRLSNVFLADRIIVLERGMIAEDGSQEELLRNKQRYAELFRYQQEKYLVGDAPC
jgi:ABC-type multidrug transport system fused ATPase/permease subunit